MSKKRKKKKAGKSREHYTYGPLTVERVGTKIKLRNRADPAEFAAGRRALATWRASVPAEMKQSSERILEVAKQFDPITVIGFLFNWNHLAPQLAGKEMSQSYAVVEHLSLLLAKEQDPGSELALAPEAAKEIVEALDEQMRVANQYVLPNLPVDESTPPDLPFRGALASILAFELGVRAERYDHQQKRLIRDLFNPFATDLQQALGFTPEKVLLVEDAYDQRIRDVAEGGYQQSVAVMVDFENIRKGKPVSDERNRELFEAFNGKAGNGGLAIALSTWIGLRTGHSIAPTVEGLAAETELPADIVRKILDTFSVQRSELENYWQIEPFNPLKRLPIVPFDDYYALPSPALFLPAVQTLLEQTLKSTAKWEAYQQHRSAYAVRRGVELFEMALPGAQVYADMKYRSSGFEGDVDILVLFEGHVFLVEVKSGDFAEAARAGIESRVHTDLEELVLKAHRQSNRALNYIESADVVAFNNDKFRLEFRRSDHSKFHLVSLTLEQLGHIVNTARAYLQRTSRTAWTVSVDDLEVVVDILMRPAQFIEYVECREALLNITQVQNVDELGFLEAYIVYGLQTDTSTYRTYDNVLMEAGSKKIDEFEHAKGRGVISPMPARKLPSEVLEVLDQLANRRPAGWLDASLYLLRMIPRHQRLVSRNIQKLRAGKRINGLIEKRTDDSLVANIRLDDPRLRKDDGIGPMLTIDASLSMLEIKP